jgi:hypothetical protein
MITAYIRELKRSRNWLRDKRNIALRIIDEQSHKLLADQQAFAYSIIMVTRKRLLNKFIFIFDKLLKFEYDYKEYLPSLNRLLRLHLYQLKKTGDMRRYFYIKERLKGFLTIIYDYAFRPNYQVKEHHFTIDR